MPSCASRGVLRIKYSSNSCLEARFYGGNWYGSSNNVGNNGNYWSSVVEDDEYAYELNFNANGNLNPQNDDDRDNGNSLRCVAR